MAIKIKLDDGRKIDYKEYAAIVHAFEAASRDKDVKGQVRALDDLGKQGSIERANLMEQLSQQTKDPFDVMVREAALAELRKERKGSRRSTFVAGPRGLEGPMGSMILGGGTSLMRR